jgi:hypothetical protein
MNSNGRPARAGQIARQAGSVATAVHTAAGLVWQVRREHDGLTRTTRCLAHSSHWRSP